MAARGNDKKIRRSLDLARKHGYVARCPEDDCLVNLYGDYDYLESGYYISQDVEYGGNTVYPTCKETLDAYVTPLCLEKGRLAGLPVPNYYISNGYYEPPVVIDPINPFMRRGRVIQKPGRGQSIARSLTRNFTYAICCQDLPSGSGVARFRCILGWCMSARFREMARRVWEIYHIPLATVRVIVCEDGSVLLSDISSLPLAKLNERELVHLERRVRWEE